MLNVTRTCQFNEPGLDRYPLILRGHWCKISAWPYLLSAASKGITDWPSVLLLCVAGVDAAFSSPSQPPTEGCSSAQPPSELVFEAVAATLPDAGSADELRERSELGFVLVE